MEIISSRALETKQAGQKLAEQILSGREKRRIIALQGGLGAGKTTFLQGFAQGLKIKKKVLSPTFIIFNKFSIRNHPQFKNFYHFDCYRIDNFKEIEALGFEEIISSSKNIVAIEWPEKIKKLLPQEILMINFKILKGDRRKIIYD
ncbi:MAG TPA: tRNA (adenosine(37)-N6)-threonylcarbamoyltransferase complex ATPase subunit type 1 TsaE [Candidatus Pacearchaeota archaeon]|nr:tRNA (adenosine(37)-N6)-threonylcarbamoyltransferase complex ATPase subunit type 1 TsaE [Candidatus Pacearchaeota archaeon]